MSAHFIIIIMGLYLIIRYKDELEDEEKTNDGGLGVMETKTCVDLLLLHEIAKCSQREQHIELHGYAWSSGRQTDIEQMAACLTECLFLLLIELFTLQLPPHSHHSLPPAWK